LFSKAKIAKLDGNLIRAYAYANKALEFADSATIERIKSFQLSLGFKETIYSGQVHSKNVE
jgi:hypothetical protein